MADAERSQGGRGASSRRRKLQGLEFGREKRLLLGWLALFMPLPLPLNGVLEWPVVFVYAGFVVYFLQRAEDRRPIVLPNAVLNVLGFIYLPILAIDLKASLLRDQAVRALLHLLLFLLVVKLFSIKQEGEKWHVLTAVFFVFVAAMATSSHLTVTVYLLAATAAGLYALARLAHLSMLGAVGKEPDRPAPLPRVRWAAWVSILLIVAVTVPVFAAMPRLKNPWILGRGGANLGLARTTGFTDIVDLNSLSGGFQQNREVAVRLRFDRPVDAGNLRLKGASFDRYVEGRWVRPFEDFRRLGVDDQGIARLSDAEIVGKVSIVLEPIGSPSLILPVEAAGVDPLGMVDAFGWGPGGDLALSALRNRRSAVDYEVLLAAEPIVATHDGVPDLPRRRRQSERDAAENAEANAAENTASRDGESEAEGSEAEAAVEREARAEDVPDGLDQAGVTPRIRELAAEVMGSGSDLERARRLERHLVNEYGYTTDFVGRQGVDPIGEFLFVHRSGHCELFATSMILMLRSQGIPARLAAGYLGAESNAFEGQLVVRESNAHAWVEAKIGDTWQLFDPTPPEGRPGSPQRDLALLFQQLYDYFAYRFDRYILSYGSEDQESFYESLKERLAALWDSFWPDEPDESLVPDEDQLATVAATGSEQTGFALWQSPKVRIGGFLVLLTGLTIFWLVWRRPLGAEATYAKLRSALQEMGFEVDAATAPLELRRRLMREVPAASAAGSRLVDLYVGASFAERALGAEDRKALRPLLGEVLDAAASVARARRKSAKRRRSG